MSTCRSCFYCIPKLTSGYARFYTGTCYQAQRKVSADMTACVIYKEREENVVLKSTSEKRNTYKDKNGNKMSGVTIPEILDIPLTIHAKREYTWGKYTGLAVKVSRESGRLAIVEITAKTPIKALNDLTLPKQPYVAKFVQKTSGNKRKYYTIEVLNGEESEGQDIGTDLPY